METLQGAEKPRYLNEVDLLKFIAIGGMIIAHVYENWVGQQSALPFPDTPLDIFVQFLGGPVCAPLFMVACGIGVIYTRHSRPVDYLRRGLIILVIAYVLNILRSYALGVLTGAEEEKLLSYLFNVDILQFAGTSFILIGMLRALGCNRWHVLILGIVMFAVSNYIGVLGVSGITGHVAGLFLFTDVTGVFFPLFEWFIYIAVGVFLGSYLREYRDHDRLYTYLFAIGLAMFVLVTVGCIAAAYDVRNFFTVYEDRYYRQTFAALVWIAGIVSMCIPSAYYLMSRYGTPRLERFCHFFGKNLNRIYIMQWIVIGNVYFALEYCDFFFDPVMSIPLGLLVMAAVSLLVPAYIKGTEYLRAKVNSDTGTFRTGGAGGRPDVPVPNAEMPAGTALFRGSENCSRRQAGNGKHIVPMEPAGTVCGYPETQTLRGCRRSAGCLRGTIRRCARTEAPQKGGRNMRTGRMAWRGGFEPPGS